MRKLLLVSLSALLMSGCAQVHVSSTTFHGTNHEGRDSIAITPIDKSQEDSLEFKSVANQVASKLVQNDYTIVQNQKSAQYVAFITYGIDNGTTQFTSIPLYGQTGGGTTNSSGTVRSGSQNATFNGTSYQMPTYGVVGTMSSSHSNYTRKVNIDIWKLGKDPIKVYEMRGFSSGSCGNIHSTLPTIIEGMFLNFPGVSGKTKKSKINWSASC